MITDLTPYRQYVDQFDLTEQQKLDLVNSVYFIVESIFDNHLVVNQVALKKRPEEVDEQVMKDFERIKKQAKTKIAKRKKQSA